ncbi:hypothetical protein [Dyadobacter psychrotolerans]|uniref:Helix-turn-helix domain-containing protein n=1 Tax=Dyadobacter psychrotolerans TaxID=2541721 RepID=A0A4R5E0M0_9BACT|nr:hypothetical protein [Dyadobacter psychrotolerans]TDE18081.1 hypothetical protein E0F88_00580 [Dyadobacter psychrotolerans]
MRQHHIPFGLTAALNDGRLNAWHLTIYFALVELFKRSNQDGPFSISRKKVMELSRIKAAPTYHKYINELQNLGYIQYHPSYHPKKGSSVRLVFRI